MVKRWKGGDHGRQIVPSRVSPAWRLTCAGTEGKPSTDDSSSLTSRTRPTRAPQRICATPSSITTSSGKGCQRTLRRGAMRTFPSRLRDPGRPWEEQRLSTHCSMCLPPLGVHLPQKVNMNSSCPVKSPFTPCNSHAHLCPLLRLSFPVYNQVV